LPTKCTICSLPTYKEIIGLLKEGAPISTTANRYGLSAYSLGRCFREHTTFDPLSPTVLLLEIRKQEKALALLRKTNTEGSLEVKRVKDHIRLLRAEYRENQSLKDGEHGTVKPEDPKTWPEWLAGFLRDHMDMCIREHETKVLQTKALEDSMRPQYQRKVTATVEPAQEQQQ
jgi:hypothetical protein